MFEIFRFFGVERNGYVCTGHHNIFHVAVSTNDEISMQERQKWRRKDYICISCLKVLGEIT